MSRKKGKDSETPLRVKALHYIALTIFSAIWLVPLAYRGTFGRQDFPHAPQALNHLYNASCLFTNSVDSWTVYYALGHNANDGWFVLEDRVFSPMQPFGYKSRMNFLVGFQWNSKRRDPERALNQQRERSEWYARRFSEIFPERAPLDQVRYIYVNIPVTKDPQRLEGHWVNPRFAELGPYRIRVIATDMLDENGKSFDS